MLDAMLRKAGFLTFKQSLELEADNREMRQRIEYLIQRNRARSEALTRERDELKQRLEGIEKGWATWQNATGSWRPN